MIGYVDELFLSVLGLYSSTKKKRKRNKLLSTVIAPD